MKLKFNKYVEIAFLLFAILGVAARFWALPQIQWQSQAVMFVVTLLVLHGLWLFYYNLDLYLNRRLPFEENITKRIAVQLIVGWSVVKLLLYFMAKFVLVNIPQFSILAPLADNRINIIIGAFASFFASVMVNLGFIANHFLTRWRENATRAARLEQEKSQVQFDNLKNQLNPHFLFNSLTSLDSLIEENPTLARQFLQQLSKVFRYVLQHKDKGLVTLSEELAFVKHYVFLLQTRFDRHLIVRFETPKTHLDKQIVPVTLQILIENALKHNIVSPAKPLTIDVVIEEDFLTVTNNIQLKKQVETSNNQGLQNLRNLYSFLTTTLLEIHQTDATFSVKIPLL
ncbi:MAG: histidine kinase [Spirosomaceae bacterium]|jgi:two-component system, LytTR family, sensor kinase|nr:histidine kinase [Spirosomataceae bacterium]